MTVSVMNLLAGNISLSASGGNMDEQGKAMLSAEGVAAFDTVMAASGQQAVSAQQLRDFFKAHGVEVPPALQGDAAGSPGQVLVDMLSAQNGKKLPGELLLALQEILPQELLPQELLPQDAVAASELDADILAALPARELSPEELSELVQQTGLTPMVILAALQETPAASPNLAVALAEGAEMGGYPTQQADSAMQAQIARAVADMMQKGVSRQEATQLATQLAGMDFAALNLEPQDVLKRIAAVLNGGAVQGEFDLDVADFAAPVNSNQKQSREHPMVQAAATPQLSTTKQAAENALTTPATPAANANGGQAQAVETGAQPATQPANFAAMTDAPQLRQAAPMNQNEPLLRHAPANTPELTEQVAVHLRKALADGTQRMEIHLKPAELGRVEVRIETDAQGKSQVMVTAEKRETLELLQRDMRGLERALSDAGLKTDSNGLSFNLKGGEGQQQAQSERDGDSKKPVFDLEADYADTLDAKLDVSEMALTYDAGRAYRLNLDWGLDISV